MGLYEEAIRYKKLAENAIKRGDIEAAKKYILVAIKKIEQLEKLAETPSLRAIWVKAKQNLMMLLESIESGAIATKKTIKEMRPTREYGKKPSRKVVAKKHFAMDNLPEVCKA